MPMYTLRWSEQRAITKEFASIEAANDWWQNADSGEIEDELDYSDCSDLEIKETTNKEVFEPNCDCPICTILRSEMVDSEREIAVYHLPDPGDHPEMDEAEFKDLINRCLHEAFGAGECSDCIMGKCPEHGVEDDFDEEAWKAAVIAADVASMTTSFLSHNPDGEVQIIHQTADDRINHDNLFEAMAKHYGWNNEDVS